MKHARLLVVAVVLVLVAAAAFIVIRTVAERPPSHVWTLTAVAGPVTVDRDFDVHRPFADSLSDLRPAVSSLVATPPAGEPGEAILVLTIASVYERSSKVSAGVDPFVEGSIATGMKMTPVVPSLIIRRADEPDRYVLVRTDEAGRATVLNQATAAPAGLVTDALKMMIALARMTHGKMVEAGMADAALEEDLATAFDGAGG